ncbi:thiol reductant ABC exporter subunit CydD [Chungangia koreensis]|uniref:Thiol reductant ABC exporter subunit CydD n=1 Tax=Chungangia koreensis TaxID=752657 RepID=A0ABV8X0N4_9LACT
MEQLKQLAAKQRPAMILVGFVSMLIGAAIISQAYLIVRIVDAVFLQHASFHSVWPELLTLMGALFLRVLLQWLHGRVGIRMATVAKKEVRQKLIKHYAENPLMASLSGQSGRKTGILMEAVDELDSYFSQYLPQLIRSSVVPLMLLVAISVQNIYSGIIILVTAPFIPIAMALIGMRTKEKSDEQLQQMTAFSGKFIDTLQGLTTYKLFGRAKEQQEEIHNSSIGFRDATMAVLKVAFLSALAMEFISMLATGIIALEVGLRLVIFKTITFFTAFFVLTLVPEFFVSLRELSSAFHTGRSSVGAAKLIQEELTSDQNPVQWGNKTLESGPPTISLNQVKFSYKENGFSLAIQTDIRQYEQVAIVGRSGSGKTTLLHLIAGLLEPNKGTIHLNRKQRSDYSEANWFSKLSYISQHPYMFAGTIRENIAISKMDATAEEIELAAKKAGLSELLRELPDGIDTSIGEAGRGLSGGEMQRVALARAFLKRPAVILFDEPTTGLDLKTEQILEQSMKELAGTATVITVAHRLHTIMHADRILFLDKGELLASGTHHELMQVEPYRDMFVIQGGERS